MLPVQTDTLVITHIEDEHLPNDATKTLVPIGPPSTHTHTHTHTVARTFRISRVSRSRHVSIDCPARRIVSTLNAACFLPWRSAEASMSQTLQRKSSSDPAFTILPWRCSTNQMFASRLEIESPSQSLLVSFCTQPLDIARHRALTHSSSCQCQSEC